MAIAKLFDSRSFAISAAIVSLGWAIVSVVWVFPFVGPLVIFIAIPWAITLAILAVVDLILGLAYRYLWEPPRIGAVIRVLPAVFLGGAVVGIPTYDALPRSQFKRYIVSPIPGSVAALRVGGERALLFDHTVMYFEIAPDDFSELLSPYSYRNVGGEIAEFEEYAQEFLQMSLDDLGPYDTYRAKLTTEGTMDSGMPITKTFVVNRARDRVLFFHLFDN